MVDPSSVLIGAGCVSLPYLGFATWLRARLDSLTTETKAVLCDLQAAKEQLDRDNKRLTANLSVRRKELQQKDAQIGRLEAEVAELRAYKAKFAPKARNARGHFVKAA